MYSSVLDNGPRGPWRYTSYQPAYDTIKALEKISGVVRVNVVERRGARRWYAPWSIRWEEWRVTR